jgi:hypothetical protein
MVPSALVLMLAVYLIALCCVSGWIYLDKPWGGRLTYPQWQEPFTVIFEPAAALSAMLEHFNGIDWLTA